MKIESTDFNDVLALGITMCLKISLLKNCYPGLSTSLPPPNSCENWFLKLTTNLHEQYHNYLYFRGQKKMYCNHEYFPFLK